MALDKKFSTHVLSGLWMVTLAVIWSAFAPVQAGGSASYIIVIGNSMEPGFHIGDLIVTHKQTRYDIGDAVAYRNLEIESFVFHRIIAEELGRYTLRGDNNSWDDTYQPFQAEILGKLWLHIPKGGLAIQKVRKPINMALIAGSLGGILAAGLFTGKPKGRKEMNTRTLRDRLTSAMQRIQNRTARQGSPELPQQPAQLSANLLEGSFFALVTVAIAALTLGIVAYSRPSTRSVQRDIGYEHVAIFSYSGAAPQGIYDLNAIVSGDPIFPTLTCTIDVSVLYTLVSQSDTNVRGTSQMAATIVEPHSAWKRSVPLHGVTQFQGNAFASTARLDLCEMVALTQSMEQGTAFHPSTYLLSVSAGVALEGDLSGRAFTTTFRPELVFRYDGVHFYVERDGVKEDPLRAAESGFLSETQIIPNTIFLFGSELEISKLRWIAATVLAVSLAGLAILGTRLQHLAKNDVNRFLHLRFDSLMIDIQAADSMRDSMIVDVSSIDDLAKLAGRTGATILHKEEGQAHMYYVQGEHHIYRFAMNPIQTETVPSGMRENKQVFQ